MQCGGVSASGAEESVLPDQRTRRTSEYMRGFAGKVRCFACKKNNRLWA